MDIHKVIGKIPFKPKRGFVLPKHKFTGPYNPLDKQLDTRDRPAGNEPFIAVDATSMRHDICYRDNPSGNSDCDKKMLAELKTIVPKNRREAVDRQLVRGIIGLKHKRGMSVWSSQLADELHKPVRRKFAKRHVFAKQIDDIWVADLVDMSSFSKTNKGYKFLLTVIDVYIKYGWIVSLKNKTGKEVAAALTTLFKIEVPSRLWTDKGTEFYNQHVRRVLDANNVTLYSTENEEKSSVAERWNRTMKRIMWKYFTANNTNKYIDELQNMVDKYNTTHHRSIELTPSEARDPLDYNHVFKALYGKIRPAAAAVKFHVGENVRISRKKGLKKGSHPIGQKRCLQ